MFIFRFLINKLIPIIIVIFSLKIIYSIHIRDKDIKLKNKFNTDAENKLDLCPVMYDTYYMIALILSIVIGLWLVIALIADTTVSIIDNISIIYNQYLIDFESIFDNIDTIKNFMADIINIIKTVLSGSKNTKMAIVSSIYISSIANLIHIKQCLAGNYKVSMYHKLTVILMILIYMLVILNIDEIVMGILNA